MGLMGEMSKNIILIGMPGSEKITIGKILSQKLGFKFVNTDQYIEDKSGKSIPELLNDGEDHFRSLEREAVHNLSRAKHSIISTGVEVIKNHSNIKELRENGVIIFIDKPVEKIIEDQEVFNNRSLLKDEVNKLHEHFSEKYETYRECCDLHLVNDNNIDDIVYYISSLCS
jgi:shikimate kinase